MKEEVLENRGMAMESSLIPIGVPARLKRYPQPAVRQHKINIRKRNNGVRSLH